MDQVTLGQPQIEAPQGRLLPWRRLLESPGVLLLLVVLATRLRGGEVDSATALAGLGAFTVLFQERGGLRAAIALATLAPLVVAVAGTSASLATGAVDAWLTAVDHAVFGEPAARWFARAAPWPPLRAALELGGLSCYLLIPAAWLAAARRSSERGEAALLALVSTFAVATLCGLLLPTSGPLVDQATTAGAGPLEWTIDLVHRLDPGAGAGFPSPHVALGVVAGWILWETAPKTRAWVVLLCATLLVSAVLGSFHYLLDAPAGVAVAAVGFGVLRRADPDRGTVPAFHRWWRPGRGGSTG